MSGAAQARARIAILTFSRPKHEEKGSEEKNHLCPSNEFFVLNRYKEIFAVIDINSNLL